MTQRDPNILDKILSIIPGYSGYAERESRRGADQRLREHVADRLDSAKRRIDDVSLALTDAGALQHLDDADRLRRRIGTCADTIRKAEHGGSGLMDDVTVKREDLDRIYEHDMGLLELANGLVEKVAALSADDFEDGLGDIYAAVEEIQQTIEQRGTLLREVF